MESLLEEMQSNQTVPRKVDKERITIGSFLAHRFGLRTCARGVFFEKSSENVSNDIFYFWDFHEI